MAKNKGQGLWVGVAESQRREHLIRPEEGNGGKYVDVWGRTFQTERRANAKALGMGATQCIYRASRVKRAWVRCRRHRELTETTS